MEQDTKPQPNGESRYSPYYRSALQTRRYYLKTERKNPHVALQRLLAIRAALKYALQEETTEQLFCKLNNEFNQISAMIDECSSDEQERLRIRVKRPVEAR